MDCSCDRCQNFCRIKPGWFTPDQIAPLAATLGVTVETLFRRYLTIDVVLAGNTEVPGPIFVLAPATVESEPGEIAEPGAKGNCVWLEAGVCCIHALKPKECAVADHTTSFQASNMLRAAIAKQWQPFTKAVQDLYGRAITVPEALKAEYERARGQTGGNPAPEQKKGSSGSPEPIR